MCYSCANLLFLYEAFLHGIHVGSRVHRIHVCSRVHRIHVRSRVHKKCSSRVGHWLYGFCCIFVYTMCFYMDFPWNLSIPMSKNTQCYIIPNEWLHTMGYCIFIFFRQILFIYYFLYLCRIDSKWLTFIHHRNVRWLVDVNTFVAYNTLLCGWWWKHAKYITIHVVLRNNFFNISFASELLESLEEKLLLTDRCWSCTPSPPLSLKDFVLYEVVRRWRVLYTNILIDYISRSL